MRHRLIGGWNGLLDPDNAIYKPAYSELAQPGHHKLAEGIQGSGR